MSIKYEPPQNIKFSYIDEKTEESFKIEYDKNNTNIIIIDKNEDAYAFPLSLFIEITDFLRGNNLVNIVKNNNLNQSSVGDLKNTSILPIPNITNKEKNDNKDLITIPDINMVDFSNIDPIVNFSPDIILQTPIKKEETKIKKESEKTEIKKRPVLDGNMPVEQASSIRGIGSEKSVIRRN